MPPEVQRAYRDPLKLTELLDSHAYSESDRLFVRDELLRALVSRFGEVEVFVGDKGRAQKVSTRVKSFKKNWLASIDLMLDVEQFGEREVTLPMLARIMEPRWQTWWSTWQVKMTPSLIYRRWSDVVVLVLGERQIRWVAAQIAREKLRGQDRQDDIDSDLSSSSLYASPITSALFPRANSLRHCFFEMVFDLASNRTQLMMFLPSSLLGGPTVRPHALSTIAASTHSPRRWSKR